MTDTGPLVKLKESMKKIKKEIKVCLGLFSCSDEAEVRSLRLAGHGPSDWHYFAHVAPYQTAAHPPSC